jgi:hypothetical protein
MRRGKSRIRIVWDVDSRALARAGSGAETLTFGRAAVGRKIAGAEGPHPVAIVVAVAGAAGRGGDGAPGVPRLRLETEAVDVVVAVHKAPLAGVRVGSARSAPDHARLAREVTADLALGGANPRPTFAAARATASRHFLTSEERHRPGKDAAGQELECRTARVSGVHSTGEAVKAISLYGTPPG